MIERVSENLSTVTFMFTTAAVGVAGRGRSISETDAIVTRRRVVNTSLPNGEGKLVLSDWEKGKCSRTECVVYCKYIIHTG